MFVFLVPIFNILVTNVHAGYNYNAPITSVLVPNVNSNINVGHAAPHVEDTNAYSTVSYSVSREDYDYLKRLKKGPQNIQYNNYHTAHNAGSVVKQPSNDHVDHYSHGNRQYFTQNDVHSETLVPSQGIVQQQTVTNLNTPGIANFYHTPPVVTKHIYFHVPPPSMEEKPIYIAPSSPPKKVYNILFIKVPSQDSRNVANLHSMLANQQSPIEDKTLIYVLVKKPEPQPLVMPVPSTKSSEHEVFYVKYKGNPTDAVVQINSELSHIDSAQNTAPNVLSPGLVNGNQ